MSNKYYTIKELHKAFNEAGLSVSKMWIYRQEQKGNLSFQRSTTNFKKSQGTRKLSAVRMITEDQIKEIILSFKPGGKGYWRYEN